MEFSVVHIVEVIATPAFGARHTPTFAPIFGLVAVASTASLLLSLLISSNLFFGTHIVIIFIIKFISI